MVNPSADQETMEKRVIAALFISSALLITIFDCPYFAAICAVAEIYARWHRQVEFARKCMIGWILVLGLYYT